MSDPESKSQSSSARQARQEAERAQKEGRKAPGTSRVEWVVAAVSGFLVAAAIAFLIYDRMSLPSSPPAFELEVDSTTAVTGGFLVQFTIRNTGATTAADVQVEGSLHRDTVEVETSQTSLDYVPTRASRKAGLFFSKDPADYRLELRPVGYVQP